MSHSVFFLLAACNAFLKHMAVLEDDQVDADGRRLRDDYFAWIVCQMVYDFPEVIGDIGPIGSKLSLDGQRVAARKIREVLTAKL